jgi:WD40 repeat protein
MALAGEQASAAFPGANGRIAYSAEDESSDQIWAANVDGSAVTQLSGGSWNRNPSFSPDGKRIAFEHWNGAGNDVLAMNADGSGQVPLVVGSFQSSTETRWEEEFETFEQPPSTIPIAKVQAYASKRLSFEDPAFSPDGSQLAVAEVSEEYLFTVVCAVAEEGDEDCIPEGEPGAYSGSRLACLGCSAHIVTISSTSGAWTADATAPPAGGYDLEPTFSAGGKLAFRRETGGESSIFVAASQGAAPSQLTFGAQDRSPDFSPDGSKVAFSQAGELAFVDVAGGAVTVVPVLDPPGGTGHASAPAFSPDGTKIAFDRGVFPQGTAGEGLYTIGLDGSGMLPVSGDGHAPSWGVFVASSPPSSPPPAKAVDARARKGKIQLSKGGRGTIGTVTCGSSACELAISSARLRMGRKGCPVGAQLRAALGPDQSTQLSVKVRGKCLSSLRKAGKGKLVTEVEVADQLGQTSLTLTATLGPAKACLNPGNCRGL